MHHRHCPGCLIFFAAAFMPAVIASPASAAPIIQEHFDQLGPPWRKNIRGAGRITLASKGVSGPCLQVVSEKRALVYYTLALDPKKVNGKSILIRCKVKSANVMTGPKVYSTAKLHVGVEVPGRRSLNFAARFTGTSDWHDEFLQADIPPDARKVTLDLGIQNGTGTAWFDELVVDDGVREQNTVSIASAANTNFHDEKAGDGYGFLDDGGPDLRHFPIGPVRFDGVDFTVLSPARNFGRTCAVLAGRKYPRFPRRIETVIPVHSAGKRLYFLLAAAAGGPSHSRTCLRCTVHYQDGRSQTVDMREGIDIGDLRAPKDLPNWKVVWRDSLNGGKVGVGLSRWENPRPAVPIAWLRLSTPGNAAAPVVIAISLEPLHKAKAPKNR